jgi:hypothetical protein
MLLETICKFNNKRGSNYVNGNGAVIIHPRIVYPLNISSQGFISLERFFPRTFHPGWFIPATKRARMLLPLDFTHLEIISPLKCTIHPHFVSTISPPEKLFLDNFFRQYISICYFSS